ncbi:hypothetical protein H5410_054255 [Solanum commersonii]|uniref:DC1 domain-containing protein n=1 Tax=Solanum commersonii TaxID=4109 RepID=A0A9J5X8R3_SOLCO|nr:hypothetical protein H5410_054255 [Solanum commersonii]
MFVIVKSVCMDEVEACILGSIRPTLLYETEFWSVKDAHVHVAKRRAVIANESVSLANVSDRPPPRDVVLNHFSHRHPLLQLHLRESEGIKCSFCNIIISGWTYACEKHCDYYLGPWPGSLCLTLEDNVSYELFFSLPFNHGKAEIDCNNCSDVVEIKDGLFYYNRERHEALHVICALREESGFDDDKMDIMLYVCALSDASKKKRRNMHTSVLGSAVIN